MGRGAFMTIGDETDRAERNAVLRVAGFASLITRRPQVPARVFDRMISLGGRCETAYQLRRHSRSERAYPFDWWVTPGYSLPRLLRGGVAATFTPPYLKALADYDGKPALYSHFGGTADLPGTIHPHEFPYGEKWLDLSLEEISARLVPKYTALERRLIEDAHSGSTLFVRQRLPDHDPGTPDALGHLVDEIMGELERLSPDFTLLLVDYPVLPPRARLIQAHVPPMRGVSGLGSVRAWRRMFRQIGVAAGRGPVPAMRDIYATLPSGWRLFRRRERV